MQEAKHLISGQLLLDYAPDWFLLYTHVIENLLCDQLLALCPSCARIGVGWTSLVSLIMIMVNVLPSSSCLPIFL